MVLYMKHVHHKGSIQERVCTGIVFKENAMSWDKKGLQCELFPEMCEFWEEFLMFHHSIHPWKHVIKGKHETVVSGGKTLKDASMDVSTYMFRSNHSTFYGESVEEALVP